MGFGAERANLMGEAAVSMPVDSNVGPSVNGGGESEATTASAGDRDLVARANNAKTNLIQEIMAFNNEREQVESNAEDHKDEAEQ